MKAKARPTDQKWSEWSKPKYASYSVTRGELVSLLVHFKMQLEEDRFWNRFKRWLKFGWLPSRKHPIGEEPKP